MRSPFSSQSVALRLASEPYGSAGKGLLATSPASRTAKRPEAYLYSSRAILRQREIFCVLRKSVEWNAERDKFFPAQNVTSASVCHLDKHATETVMVRSRPTSAFMLNFRTAPLEPPLSNVQRGPSLPVRFQFRPCTFGPFIEALLDI